MDIIKKLILRDHPNYDFGRYSFRGGDVVVANDNSKIVVKESAIEYVTAYVIRRGFKYNKLGEQRVFYSDLPYFKKGKFVPAPYKLSKSLRWELWDIRKLDSGMTVLLYEVQGFQAFYGFVLDSGEDIDLKCYHNTGIYVSNPKREYIIER